MIKRSRERRCGCSSVVEHLLAKERVESSNLFIRFLSYLRDACNSERPQGRGFQASFFLGPS